MTKDKSLPAVVPTVELLPIALAAAAPSEAPNPAAGGSYTRDPLTGELRPQQPAVPTTERSE